MRPPWPSPWRPRVTSEAERLERYFGYDYDGDYDFFFLRGVFGAAFFEQMTR